MNNTINNRKNKQLNKKNTINLIEGVFNQLENTDFFKEVCVKKHSFYNRKKDTNRKNVKTSIG